MNANPSTTLTLNSGSSSLKFALYATEQSAAGPTEAARGSIQRIGLSNGVFQAEDAAGKQLARQTHDTADHAAALRMLLSWIAGQPALGALAAVGHRIVHGGAEYTEPARVTPALVESLKKLIPLAPEHLPHEIAAIETIGREHSDLSQVACFDTAFHRRMPAVAQTLPLPRRLASEGVLRYGFHGLSYEYIVGELRRTAGDAAADGRLVIAHLGNGASMAAVYNGQSRDTTMGFTPAGGLMMSTRTGDLDPGALIYLARERGLDAAALQTLVNEQSGLLGISETSSDMADLLKHEAADPRAAAAIELFCYTARKTLAALAAALGGLETLVFTAGIGENAPAIRWRICEDLAFLGIRLDPARNDAGAAIISADDSRVTVRVMKTNEELMIARHAYGVLQTTSS